MKPSGSDNVGGVPPPRRHEASPGEGTRPTSDDDSPGVPGFRAWRGVYLLVLGVFILVVIALTLFTRAFA